jgi:hypothetical protein
VASDIVTTFAGMTPDARRELFERLRELGTSRLDRRDEAVRALLRFYSGPPSGTAKAAAKDLDEYLANVWPRERKERGAEMAPRSAHRQALREVARLNGGSLGWRQILNIAHGHRGR